jgi:hypothetical protein
MIFATKYNDYNDKYNDKLQHFTAFTLSIFSSSYIFVSLFISNIKKKRQEKKIKFYFCKTRKLIIIKKIKLRKLVFENL